MSNRDYLFDEIPNLKDNAIVVRLPEIEFLFASLPSNLFIELNSEINLIEKNFNLAKAHNNQLAGHIKREFEILNCIPKIEGFVVSHANWFLDKFNLWPEVLTSSRQLKLKTLWVNFQQKYEFNPPHTHSGVISFVIWMRIPFNLKDEMDYFPRGTADQTSRFGFLTTTRLGQIQSTTIPIDKGFEGKICFFPSQTVHYVNPFYTSDGFRVSISGNLYYDVDQKL